MKKDRLLNPNVIEAIAAIGHTEYFMIADAGLPVPRGVRVIDLSVVRGVPTFLQVLQAVMEELVVESSVLATEMPAKSAELYEKTLELLQEGPCKMVSHEELKKMTEKAKIIIRTGETTPYANVILVAGVNF